MKKGVLTDRLYRAKKPEIMKTILCMTMIMSAAAALGGPVIFSGGRLLHAGKGEQQSSRVYEFAGPYALRWTLRDVKPTRSEDALADYWKPHTRENPPWVSIRVVDAETRKVLESTLQTAWQGVLQVAAGGRHYLVVTGKRNVAWSIHGREGMLSDNVEGLREARPEDTGGKTAAEVAGKLIARLERTLEGREKEERVAAVRLIEARSSSAEDFESRWQAYRKVMGWD